MADVHRESAPEWTTKSRREEASKPIRHEWSAPNDEWTVQEDGWQHTKYETWTESKDEWPSWDTTAEEEGKTGKTEVISDACGLSVLTEAIAGPSDVGRVRWGGQAALDHTQQNDKDYAAGNIDGNKWDAASQTSANDRGRNRDTGENTWQQHHHSRVEGWQQTHTNWVANKAPPMQVPIRTEPPREVIAEAFPVQISLKPLLKPRITSKTVQKAAGNIDGNKWDAASETSANDRGRNRDTGENTWQQHNHSRAEGWQQTHTSRVANKAPPMQAPLRTEPPSDVIAEALPVLIPLKPLLKPCITSKAVQEAALAFNGLVPAVEEPRHASRFAWVTCIFGRKLTHCIEAAVLGSTLKVSTIHELVAMYTKDVPDVGLGLLRQVGWKLRPVEYLDGDALYDGSSGNRFRGVFTKLQALSLIEYKKIVVVDADLLVRHNVDELFDVPAPAALRRGASGNTKTSQAMRGFIRRSTGKLAGGINAGVMVLEPNVQDHTTVLGEMNLVNEEGGDSVVEFKGRGSAMPDQDYLTRFYKDEWRALGVEFNFQLHQLAFCDRAGLENCRRLTIDYQEDVHIGECFWGENIVRFQEGSRTPLPPHSSSPSGLFRPWKFADLCG